jgi:glycolate oxidase FAD binding subunit
VGPEHIRAAGPADAVDLVIPRLVVMPGDAGQAAGVIQVGAEAGLGMIARGGGTKLGWGNRPAAFDLVVDMGRMDAVLEHAWGDMTVTVQAGCSIARLQATLAEHGQRLALDPLWPERATVGGVLATGDGGPLRTRFGALRDQVIGVTVALADGTLAKSGGKVVKNVAGYDLPKLMTGALGTLGLIAEANFRLYPLPQATRDLRVDLADAALAGRALLALLDAPLAPAAIQVRAGSGARPQIDLRFEGHPTVLDAQERQLGLLLGAAAHAGEPGVWVARERLWQGQEPALVCKLSILPADFERLCALLDQVAGPLRLSWSLALSGPGVGWLRLEGANDEALLAALVRLRGDIAVQGGSLSAMGCPAGIKSRLDVWGEESDALALMRRVKERFDPSGALSRGRFVGGI